MFSTRSYRPDQSCNDIALSDSYTPQAHVSTEMLGHVQKAWLDEGLGNERTWNLLARQVVVMPLLVDENRGLNNLSGSLEQAETSKPS